MELAVQEEKVGKIAELNDSFRQGGLCVLSTPGIRAMSNVAGLLKAVRNFNIFTEDNDPHSEHDFGSLVWEGKKVFWKIDYYDITFKRWADPLSPRCHRV